MLSLKFFTYTFLILVTPAVQAQYIAEVLEYKPAPGQFINTSPWGVPGSASSIVGGVNGTLCLGAFGGEVVFRFEQPVENHSDNPFGVDFSIFGNPMPDWSEPGAVWVMKDENMNGAPDDTWYELTGSDYYFSSSARECRVTYSNPGNGSGKDVPWADQFGNTGFILANAAHTQTYYPSSDLFPDIPGEQYTLSGTMITGVVDVDHPPILRSARRAFGYADNRFRGNPPYTVPDNPYTPEIENSGGDAFDISWAVDVEGNYMDLDRVDFVKVQNALLHEGGWLGEVSTEITGAVDVEPDHNLSGNLEMIVIGDLPEEIHTTDFQLEVFVYHQGRMQPGQAVGWTTSEDWARVGESHVLTTTGSGINASTTSSQYQVEEAAGISIYPNPAREILHLSGPGNAIVTILDPAGKTVKQVRTGPGTGIIRISSLAAGIYLVRVDQSGEMGWFKFLKE